MSNSDDLDFGQTIRGFAEGQKVFGRYILRKVLGRGGMGIVWLAWDEKLERDIALKFMPEMVRLDASAVDELKRETRKSLSLTHANIVRIFDYVDDGQSAAIAMEYIEGATLSALRVEKSERVFEVEELRIWAAQICEALAYAHDETRIVHRDLKPANLMVTSNGRIKITDFGIARSICDSASRMSMAVGNSSGTLVYMSPQQLDGDNPSALDDIYSLGATFYELLTSRPPFFSGNIHAQVKEKVPPPMSERRAALEVVGQPIPADWETTIAACMAKYPKHRPQSVREVLQRLEGSGHPSTPKPPPNIDPPGPGSKPGGQRTAIFLGIFGVILLAGGASYYFGIHRPAENAWTIEVARRETEARATIEAQERLRIEKENAEAEAARQVLAALNRTNSDQEKAEKERGERLRIEKEAASAEHARLAEARAALTAQTLAAAREAHQARDWTRAETLIGNILALDPSNAAAHQLKGEITAAKQILASTPPPAAAARPATNGRWIFPDSSNRYLKPGELVGMDKDTLWRARNEIYVRRGYIFTSERGQKFARSFGAAYSPRISGEEAMSRVFNSYETANVETIRDYENAR